MKYTIYMTNKFKKDYKRNNFDEKEFIKVVSLLADGKELPEKYCNHILEPRSARYLRMSYKTWLATGLYYK